MVTDNLKVYLAGGILILLVLVWIYLKSNSEDESLQDELEDDDDTRDVRESDVAKVIDN
jgi:hypothetical protein